MPRELSLQELLALPLAQEEGETVEGEGEEHAEEDPPNPVLPTGNEVIWAAVFFFALWALMKYVLLPPLNKTRAERAQKIAAAKDASEEVSGDLAAVQAQYDAKIGDARAEASRVVEDARAEAEAARSEVIAAAEAEVAALRGPAEAEIATARQAAIDGLRPELAQVATSAASSLVGRNIGTDAANAALDSILAGDKS